MEVFIFIFIYIYAFIIVPVSVFFILAVLTGVPCLLLYKRIYPEFVRKNKRSVLTLLFLQTLILEIFFALPASITKAELLNNIIILSEKNEFIALKLFSLFVQKDLILRFMMNFAMYLWIFIPVNLTFAFFAVSNIQKFSRNRRLSFLLCHSLFPVSIILLILSVYTLIPRIQPIGQLTFLSLLPGSRPKDFFELTHDTRQARFDKMLIFAVQTSTAEMTSLLLKYGANPNRIDKSERPALLVASYGSNAFGNRDSTFKLLVEAGADINSREKSGVPIIVGIMESKLSMETKKYFLGLQPDLNARNEHSLTPIMSLYSHGYKELIWELIEHGADINVITPGGQTLLNLVLQKKDREFADELIDRGAKINITELVEQQDGQTTTLSPTARTFMGAIRSRDFETIDYLLNNGFDINTKDEKGLTGLQHAVEIFDKELIALLLEKGADPSSVGVLSAAVKKSDLEFTKFLLEKEIPLTNEIGTAVTYNNEAMVALLLANGADTSFVFSDGDTLLDYAIRKKRDSMARLLLKYGALPKRALHHAVKNGDINTLQVLLDNGADINTMDSYYGSPLLVATMSAQDPTIIKYLLANGADPNISVHGWNPLKNIVQSGNKEIIALMLEYGADPNITDQYGHRPISIAAMIDNRKIVELLLKKGFDINHQDLSGRTELIGAIESGREESIQSLLDLGADPNQVSKNGRSPLGASISRQNTAIARLLLKHDADPNTQDIHGQSLLWWAVYYAHTEMIALLLEHGANVDIRNKKGQTVLWVLGGRTQKSRLTGASNIKFAKEYQGKGKGARTTLGELYDFSIEKDIETARLLIENGLDPSAQDSSGQDAYAAALDNKNEKLARFLKNYLD